jgi:23S rRNA pseudouridine1911/1915/1917 synthase
MSSADFRTFHVSADHEGQSLAASLREFLPDRSWSQIKRLVDQRHVQVNGNLCVEQGRRVKAGEVVRVSAVPLPTPVAAKDVRLVHVDDQVVVIDKPPGVTTLRHTAEQEWDDRRKQRQPTLDELVDELLAGRQRPPRSERERRIQRKRPGRVRAVHRLDRDTSGLMVFARTPEAESSLIRQFKEHTVDRAYIAIVHGRVEEQIIDTRFVRDRGDGLRGSTSDASTEGAQRAITHVRPLEYLPGYSVVECRLETGRTHQIRIHLSERGHRLCGEKTYTHSLGGPEADDRSGASRQALHAALLGVVHPTTGDRRQFVSPIPNDMRRLLETLRGAEVIPAIPR